MKTMQKLVSILLVLGLVFSLSLGAFADATAEDDHFRIDQVDDAGDRLRKVSDKPMVDFNGNGILLAGSVKDGLGIDV